MINFTPGNTLFAVPLSDSIGYDAIAIQGTNVYMGGNIQGFTQDDPNVPPPNEVYTNCQNIIRFDGNDYGWIMGTGLNGVPVALTALGTNLFAAGAFTTANGVAANQIAQWDGNQLVERRRQCHRQRDGSVVDDDGQQPLCRRHFHQHGRRGSQPDCEMGRHQLVGSGQWRVLGNSP